MPVCHAILVPFGCSPPGLVHLDQIPRIAIESHLQIHTHSPIERCARTINVQVRKSHFDDFGKLSAGFLIRCNADFGFVVPRIKVGANGAWQSQLGGLSEFVEIIGFSGMNVVHSNAGF